MYYIPHIHYNYNPLLPYTMCAEEGFYLFVRVSSMVSASWSGVIKLSQQPLSILHINSYTCPCYCSLLSIGLSLIEEHVG